MRIILPYLLVLGLFSGYAQNKKDRLLITGLQSSVLTIEGSTNVNCFECIFNSDYLKPKQALTFEKRGNLFVLDNAVIQLDLAGFNCGGKAINNDFMDMLKADEYPAVFLNFTQVLASEKGYEATVVISLAGQEHTYILPIYYDRTDLRHARGKLEVNISDYDLKKPRKLMGLIKIDDVITIHFDISGAVEDF